MEEAWGTLSPEEGRARCVELAGKLEKDGWDNIFLEPLRKAEAVIKVNAWHSHRELSLNLSTATL